MRKKDKSKETEEGFIGEDEEIISKEEEEKIQSELKKLGYL